MALRACLLLAVLALAKAQMTGSGMTGFNSMLASSTREAHFYCLPDGETTFPTDTRAENSDTIQTYRRWTVFLQFPVLSYLDSMRKPALIRAIASFIGRDESEFCIATVENYRVSYYDESVLVSFYFLTNRDDPDSILTNQAIMNINDAFQSAIRAGSGSSPYLRSFLGRTAITISTNQSGLPNDNIHPGAANLEVIEDPTLNAVPLGSWIGNLTLQQVLEQRDSFLQDFADNPNPRSLGLEAGDIVFAIFGSIFLAILGGAIILGFCIHPFFLS